MPLTDEQFLEKFNARQSALGVMFGARILVVSQTEGRVRIAYDVGPQFCNPRGTVQGGIIATLLDEAAAHAGIVKMGERGFIVSLEFKTSFFGAAKQGALLVEARCLKMGRSICYLEADLLGPDEALLARMTQTATPLRNDQKPNLVETPA